MAALQDAINISNTAVEYLNSFGDVPKFLFCQEQNLGDTLHITPIIHHYRIQHNNAAMVFITGQPYHNAHEYNPHINKLLLVQKMSPQDRIALRKHQLDICSKNNIKLISPSIFPHGEVWKELAWSHPIISHQYWHNAGITGTPAGGTKLIVKTTQDDEHFVNEFIAKNNINCKMTCLLEYHSYSHPVSWDIDKWKLYVNRLKKYNISCVSLCAEHEGVIPNTIPGKGLTWRQTVALANRISFFSGVASGNTMLVCAAEKIPKILEILISPAVSASKCGFADSIIITNPDPVVVADHLFYKVLHG